MKVLLWLVGIAAVVVLLFTIVFPWFNDRFVTDPVLESGSSTDPAAATTPFQPEPLGEVTDY